MKIHYRNFSINILETNAFIALLLHTQLSIVEVNSDYTETENTSFPPKDVSLKSLFRDFIIFGLVKIICAGKKLKKKKTVLVWVTYTQTLPGPELTLFSCLLANALAIKVGRLHNKAMHIIVMI